MTLTKKKVLGGAGIAGLILATSAIVTMKADASDHAEAPAAQNRATADIGDLYVWADGGNTTAIVTVSPLTPAGMMATPDRDVLYGFHFDTDDDNVADIDIWARFGQNADGDWGVQISGPGGTFMGPMGEVITEGDMSAYAGTTDDPFFFDLEGYTETLNTGTLSFMSARDSIAGTNVMSIAIQMPTANISDVSFKAWATTAAM